MSRFALLLPLLLLPALGLMETTHLSSVEASHATTPQYAFAADTTCPPFREAARYTLVRFLSIPDFQTALLDYGIVPADTSEVTAMFDAAACAALDSTLAQALADSVLYYDPDMYYRSYFSSDSFYYAVEIPKPLDSLGIDTTPPPGIEDYVYVAMSSVVVFGKDFSFKEGFPY